jgi:hypothetical protein
MGIQVTFHCDHEGCMAFYAVDPPDRVPIDLSPVVRYLTDDPVRGGRGWEIAVGRMPPPVDAVNRIPLLLVHKCFCPVHGDDLQAMPEYLPDTVAKQHARRHH